jgi:hypothetical protein
MGVGATRGDLPTGLSGQAGAVVQVNAGAGASVGASVVTDGNTTEVARGVGGVGAGAAVSAGVQGTAVAASPPLFTLIKNGIKDAFNRFEQRAEAEIRCRVMGRC